MKKRLFLFTIITMLILSLLAINVSAGKITGVVASGKCGDNLTWTLYTNGELIISGTGDMWNWTKDSPAPWYSYNDRIQIVAVEDGVTSIGDYAFYFSKMVSFGIPNSIKSIGDYAFSDCGRLLFIKLVENLISIGDSAFSGCRSLKSIDIPANVSNIGKNVFYDCYSLQNISVNSSNQFYSSDDYGFLYNKDKTTLITAPRMSDTTACVLPSTVKEINSYAFAQCVNLTSITLPDGITTINPHTFEHCTALTSINIPEGVTEIGNSAFAFCNNLTDIEIPTSVSKIDYMAFYSCSSLVKATVLAHKASIDDYHTFANAHADFTIYGYAGSTAQTHANKNLYPFVAIDESASVDKPTTTNSPKTDTSITVTSGECGENLSWVLSEAGELIISGTGAMTTWKNVSSVPWYSIRDQIISIKIQDGITSIGAYAFRECINLTDVSLPNSLTSIGNMAFMRCSALTTAKIPNGVTNIKYSAFRECTALTSIEIPDSVAEIGNNAFYECSSLISIDIPSSMTNIGTSIFIRCKSLENVVIPQTITSIGRAAFSECTSLKNISIPQNVTNIDERAFFGSTALKSVYFYGDAPSMFGEKVFSSTSRLTLYYIEGKKGWTTPTWNGYKTAVFIPDSPVSEAPETGSMTGTSTTTFLPGTPMGDVLYTDIVAYIDDYAIRSYNIAGNTYIVVEDLMAYGFDVQWLPTEGKLVVDTTRTAAPSGYTTTYVPEKNTHPGGTVAMPYLYTEITAWLGDKQVTGYNIGGYTCIGMDDLAAVFATNYVWDAAAGALRLYTQP